MTTLTQARSAKARKAQAAKHAAELKANADKASAIALLATAQIAAAKAKADAVTAADTQRKWHADQILDTTFTAYGNVKKLHSHFVGALDGLKADSATYRSQYGVIRGRAIAAHIAASLSDNMSIAMRFEEAARIVGTKPASARDESDAKRFDAARKAFDREATSAGIAKPLVKKDGKLVQKKARAPQPAGSTAKGKAGKVAPTPKLELPVELNHASLLQLVREKLAEVQALLEQAKQKRRPGLVTLAMETPITACREALAAAK